MSLIKSYGLLTDGRVEIIRPRKAGYVDLASFHSSDYLDACFDPKLSSDPDDGSADENGRLSEFGLELDCHLVPGLPDLMGWVAGGSIAAANWLVTNYEGPEAANLGKCRVALNWGGGWHHAQKDQASGFCYVNDVVLAILELRSRFSKILYVDLDVHHGQRRQRVVRNCPIGASFLKAPFSFQETQSKMPLPFPKRSSPCPSI